MSTQQRTENESLEIAGNVHRSLVHDSAYRHVSGEARYIDDLPEPNGLLHLYIAMSERAHAKILKLDLDEVEKAAGVIAVFSAADIPGENNVGPVRPDDPLFAEHEVLYHGQSLFAVAAVSEKAARLAAGKAKIDYEELPALITISDALRHGSHIEAAQVMQNGDPSTIFAQSDHQIEGRFSVGGQDHFYLEGQIAMAVPGEDGEMLVYSSTQNPSETQHIVAHVLGLSSAQIDVEVRRMGGGFGGKETQSALIASVAALCAHKTGRPSKLRLDRDDDMVMTGKRHDFEIAYKAGFDSNGVLSGAEIDLASRCGYSTDLSMAINDRAMFHCDNCYSLGVTKVTSHRLKTHTVSNTAFRGFGGPQGMIVAERLLDEIAFKVGRDPLDVRLDNLYRGPDRNVTHYHQTVEDMVAGDMMRELAETSDYRARRAQIEDQNKQEGFIKRGIALTPVKFGISFTTKHLNQAGALVHVFMDGSIQLNHGGTEMGQGLMVKVAQIVAHEFQVDIDRIRIKPTSTEKVPNTSATAASSGTDLNGKAAQAAARTIKMRLIKMLSEKYDVEEAQIAFSNNQVHVGEVTLRFEQVVREAYLSRISLSSTGFYKTPKIHYDRKNHRGRPFYYFAYGVAVSEVELDILTGENRVVRTDILHDVGKSINPAIDLGQIEGGFIQGMGWLTTEELVFDDKGRLRTHAPSTYKIPACGDRPDEMNIDIWKSGVNREEAIHRSKAVGEPPFMLAISVFNALSHAVSGATGHKIFAPLDAPATAECLLMAVEVAQAKAQQVK